MDAINLYELLSVSEESNLKEIKIAYKRKALEYLKSINDENVKYIYYCMKKLNEAYIVLSNPKKRLIYDFKVPNSEKKYYYKKSYMRLNGKLEKYEYYNSIDYDKDSQKHFINWLETFADIFIRKVYEYYLKNNILDKESLYPLFHSFDDIFVQEKEELIKKGKVKKLN